MLRVSGSVWLGFLVALLAFAVVLVASSSPNSQREAVEAVFNLPFTTKVEAERTVPFSPKVDLRIIVNEEPSKHFSLSRLMNVRDTHDELDTRSCIPGGSSEVKATLETCCWYNDATCCNKNLASVVVPYIKGNLSKLQSELGFGDQCYFAIADLVCMICSPNTATFIKTVGGSFQVHICDSLCEKIYGACMNDLNKIPGLDPNVKNGEQFCAALFKDAKAKGNIVFGKKDDGTCYDGVPLEQVEKGYCLPGQKPPSDSGDGDSAAKLALIVVPIVLGFVLLAVAIAGVVAYVYYRKRVQRQQQMDIALQDVSPWVN